MREVIKPSHRKEMARLPQLRSHKHSLCLLCMNVSESCFYYQEKLNAENEQIADMADNANRKQKTLGVWPMFLYLRNVKGFTWNHKRVYRIYCELELNLKNQAL